ncbi:MAG: GLUG motif-containing protein [bacterium]|jgi:hypothetical protein
MTLQKKVSRAVVWMLILAVLLPGATFAQIPEIKGHWAEETINRWADKGLIAGYGVGTYGADKSITRAEFVAFTNRVFGYSGDVKENFADVPAKAWYAGEVAAAKAHGYIGGYGGDAFRPEANISREEVCAIIARVMHLKVTEDYAALEGYQDAATIDKWSKGVVNAAVAGGYMGGYGDKTLKIKNFITRAEAVTMLDRTTGALYSKAGTYGPETGAETIAGNVTVNTEGVMLRNMVIEGVLHLAAGVGAGDVTLDNVQVKGATLIRGGENNVVVRSCTLSEVVIAGSRGRVCVVAQGDSAIGQISMETGAKLQEEGLTGAGFENVTVDVATEESGRQIDLEGEFESVIIETAVEITITGDTVINNLQITENAAGTTVNVAEGAALDSLTLNARTTVRGTGAITLAAINAAGCTLKQSPAKVVIAAGITAIIGGKEVAGTVTSPGTLSPEPEPSAGSSSKRRVSAINIATKDADTGDVIDVRGGVDNDTVIKVTLTTATGGADIYYTTDGSTPTASSTKYTVPFDVDTENAAGEMVTIKAIGIKARYSNSAVAEKEIVFKPTPSEFAGGDGSEGNPYQVATAEQLDKLRNYLDKYFIQTADIDLADYLDVDGGGYNEEAGWEPIGTNDSPFTGSYNGAGKTISNLKIARPEQNYVGLFGMNTGSISNVSLLEVDVNGYWLVGGLIGENSGIVSDSNVSGSVKGIYHSIGGLIGSHFGGSGNVMGCSSSGIVSIANDDCSVVGGLVGQISQSRISGSYSTSTVNGGINHSGGLIGYSWYSTIDKCFATGNVTGVCMVGGLVGDNNSMSEITNCYATGSVSGSGYYIGGLIGRNYSEITNSYSIGSVNGETDDKGGLVGQHEGGTYSNSYYDTNTSGQSDTGKGIPKTTLEMKQQATFTDWDFDTVWGINPDENGGYPFLRWQGYEHIPDTTKPVTGVSLNKSSLELVAGENETLTATIEPVDATNQNVTWTSNAESVATVDSTGKVTAEAAGNATITVTTVHGSFTAQCVVTVTPSEFAGGDGTSGNPYQLATAEHLNNVRNHLSAYFEQTDDIDLTDYLSVDGAGYNEDNGWEPIGNSTSPFKGNFNGNGKTISNLKIARSSNMIGLFGQNEGVIHNVSLSEAIVSGSAYVGGLVGFNYSGTVTDSTVTGSTISDATGGTYVGGLIGYNDNNRNYSGQVTGCYSAGSVSATASDFVGGLIGGNSSYAYVNKSHSTSTVTGGGNRTGGLIGQNYRSTINECFATGNVTGNAYVGGLVGENSGGEAQITNSYATGTVTGTSGNIGGLVGRSFFGPTITNSYATGTVMGTGGLVGGVQSGATVTNSYWDKDNSGLETSAGGTGKTTAEMTVQTTYSGWDFGTIWAIETAPASYPYLQWQGNENIPYPYET